jgi:hypothetical protein
VSGPDFRPYPLPAAPPAPPAPVPAAPPPPARPTGGISRRAVAAGVAAALAVIALVAYLGTGGSPTEPDALASPAPSSAPPTTALPTPGNPSTPKPSPVNPSPVNPPPRNPLATPAPGQLPPLLTPSPASPGPSDPTAAGELVGTVTDALGAPITGATVTVTRATRGDTSDVAVCPTPVRTRTGATGRYAVALCQLGPGLGYHVTVRSGIRTAVADLYVAAGQATTLAVVLDVRPARSG